MTKGIAKIRFGRTPKIEDAELIELKLGDSFKVYPYQWHQIMSHTNYESMEPLEIIECSTYHEDSDTYRDATDWYDIGVSKKKE